MWCCRWCAYSISVRVPEHAAAGGRGAAGLGAVLAGLAAPAARAPRAAARSLYVRTHPSSSNTHSHIHNEGGTSMVEFLHTTKILLRLCYSLGQLCNCVLLQFGLVQSTVETSTPRFKFRRVLPKARDKIR